MSDMTADQARAILREAGHDVPEKGKLAATWWALARDIRDGTEPGSPQPGEPVDEYTDGVTEGDFTAAADPPDEAPVVEAKPRRVRAARPSLRDRMKGGGQQGKGKRKPAHKRVPVDRLISLGWEGMGRLFGSVSVPAGRCMQMQAPVAGLVLEDVVRGTVVDRALQPLARAEEKSKAVLALAGPPTLVMAIERAQLLDDDQRRMREALLLPMLRESLVLWGEIASDKLEVQRERMEKRGPAYEEADRLLALIFAPPPGGGATPDPEPAMASA